MFCQRSEVVFQQSIKSLIRGRIFLIARRAPTGFSLMVVKNLQLKIVLNFHTSSLIPIFYQNKSGKSRLGEGLDLKDWLC